MNKVDCSFVVTPGMYTSYTTMVVPARKTLSEVGRAFEYRDTHVSSPKTPINLNAEIYNVPTHFSLSTL